MKHQTGSLAKAPTQLALAVRDARTAFLLDLWVNPHFLSLRILDGHLFGAPIDILNRAAPLRSVATGMTFVIATRGIDISVGAVVAIAGAAAATILASNPIPSRRLIGEALGAALIVGILSGMWNGTAGLFVGMQPIIATLILMVAGRGVAQLLTGGRSFRSARRAICSSAAAICWRCRFPCGSRQRRYLLTALLIEGTALGLFIRAIGVNPVATRLVGLRSKAIVFAVYAFSGLTASIAGILISSNVRSADGNNAGLLLELDAILAVTLGGTSLLGRPLQSRGHRARRAHHPDADLHDLFIGVPPEATLVVKAVVVLVVSVIQSPSASCAWRLHAVQCGGGTMSG